MKSIKRVLLVQPYGIGDFLFMTPVLRALRLVPGIERVDLLLGSRTSEMARENPHADDLIVVDKDLFHKRSWFKNLKESLALFFKLRSRRYDLMIDYSLRDEYGFMALLLGIPKRAGFAYKKRGKFYNVRFPLPEGFTGRHVCDFDSELAEKAGIRVLDRFMEYYVSEKDRREAATVLMNALGNNFKESARYIVVVPGGGESWGKDAHFKRWPAAYFADLCGLLRTRMDFDFVVIAGSDQEKEFGEQIKKSVSFSVINLAGEISLGASAAILEKAALLLANDGGLVHLASVFQTPVIAFYGPVDPAVYGPYPPYKEAVSIVKENLGCRPCYKKFRYKSDCVSRECLTQLLPQEVFGILESRSFFEPLKEPQVAGKSSR